MLILDLLSKENLNLGVWDGKPLSLPLQPSTCWQYFFKYYISTPYKHVRTYKSYSYLELEQLMNVESRKEILFEFE